MKYSKEIARELCEQLGIKWDEAGTAPTLRGKAITAETVASLFSVTRLTWGNVSMSSLCSAEDLNVDAQVYTGSAVMIDHNSPADNTYKDMGKALLAA